MIGRAVAGVLALIVLVALVQTSSTHAAALHGLAAADCQVDPSLAVAPGIVVTDR